MKTLRHVASVFGKGKNWTELGEAFPEIAAAEEAYNNLRRALERVQRAKSQEADDSATEFLALLSDARKDSSWPILVGDAEEAFLEVKPVKMEAA